MQEQALAAALQRVYADIEDLAEIEIAFFESSVEVTRQEMNKRFARLIHFRARSEGQKRRWGKEFTSEGRQ